MRIFNVSGHVVNGGNTVTIRHKADGNVETIAFKGLPAYAEGQNVTLGGTRLIRQGSLWLLTLPAFTAAFVARLRVEYGPYAWDSAHFSVAIDPDNVIAVDDAFTAKNFKAVVDEIGAAREGDSSLLARFMKFMRRAPIVEPTGFTWANSALHGHIFRSDDGKFYTDFDVSTLKASEGVTYYVNQTTGSDENDGLTVATALQSIAAAHAKANVSEIVICERRVYFTYGMNGTSITKDLAIRGLNGIRPIICNHASITWALAAGQTYTYSYAATAPGTVVDMSRRNAHGDMLELALKASIAEVEAAEDTYFIDTDSTTYVHVKGGEAPGYFIAVVRNDRTALTAQYAAGGTLYMENVDVVGGMGIPAACSFYAKNCTFQYGKYDDCLTTAHADSILQDCVASGAKNDGFSYSYGHAIEIGCTARYNGKDENDDNGSTSHNGALVIRLNGTYHHNTGPNVADVHDDTQSWNLGCDSYDSASTIGYNYYTSQGDTEMWLDSCLTHYDEPDMRSLHDVYAADASKIHLHNVSCWDTGVAGTAVIDTY
jgi:hypothetical protein